MISYFILIAILVLFIGNLLKALNVFVGEPDILFGVFILIFTILSFLPISGFMLIFPAAAIGKPMKLSVVAIYAEHNISRIWFLYILAFLSPIIVTYPFVFLFDWLVVGNEPFFMVADLLITTFVTFFFFMITVGVLSLSYVWLVEQRELP